MSLNQAIQERNKKKIENLLENEMFSDEELRDAIFLIYQLNQMDLMFYFVKYRSVWDLIFYFAVRMKNLELYETVLKSSNFDPMFELSQAHINLVQNKKFNMNEINKPDLMGITPFHLLFWKKLKNVEKYVQRRTEEYVEDKFGRLPQDYK